MLSFAHCCPQDAYSVDLGLPWPLPSTHPGQCCLVGSRNDQAALQHCFFFWKGGEGVEGEVFVTACQCFKQLYLKTRFSLFIDPLFSLQRRWSRCTYEHKKLWGIYWPLAQGGGGRESHACSHPLCSLSRACMYAKFVEQKKEKEKTSVVRLNKIWQCLFLTFLSKTVARE